MAPCLPRRWLPAQGLSPGRTAMQPNAHEKARKQSELLRAFPWLELSRLAAGIADATNEL